MARDNEERTQLVHQFSRHETANSAGRNPGQAGIHSISDEVSPTSPAHFGNSKEAMILPAGTHRLQDRVLMSLFPRSSTLSLTALVSQRCATAGG